LPLNANASGTVLTGIIFLTPLWMAVQIAVVALKISITTAVLFAGS